MGKTSNKYIEIKNNSSKESIDIYVYGVIISGADKWDEDDVIFNDFKNALKEKEDVKEINLYINSPGGSVFATEGIIAELKRHQAKGKIINAYIDGLGASCASILPMVADNIYTYKHSLMMIHHPMSGCWGNVNDFQKSIDRLNKVEDSVMIPLYLSKVKEGITEEKIKELVNEETWLNAKEMAEIFNITILDEEKELTACIEDTSIFNHYKNAPKSINKFIENSFSKGEIKNDLDINAIAKVVAKKLKEDKPQVDDNEEKRKEIENKIKEIEVLETISD